LPLEIASFISDLVLSNPAHTDGLSQADSHMRLIKATVKATFPNFTAVALASTQAQLDAAAAVAAGTAVHTFPAGTAALPGLTCVLDPTTGWSRPAANQTAYSISGVQVLLMGSSALVTSLGVAAAAFTTTGAYSGGTGQLVPIGAVLEWYDDVLPTEGGYAWANGQIIASANIVCPILLARWGSRFGGNGTTTMGVPDRRDTVGIGKSTMGGVSSRGLQTLANTVLGTLIGVANYVMLAANLPPITSSGVNTISVSSTGNADIGGSTQSDPGTGGPSNHVGGNTVGVLGSSGNNNITVTSTGTTSTAMSLMQPSTTCNYIVRLG
jgi:microcystin-dependent protein